MASIKDVAKRAGVAISTVSKVLNNYPNVSGETQRKVRTAIEELGFVPNAAASMLSSKQAGRIALLINQNRLTQAVDEIDMQYITGAINQAKKLNMDIITLFFSMIMDMSLEEITGYLRSQNIVGLVICGMDRESRILQELIRSKRFKMVVIDAPFQNETTSSIGIDHEKAQYDVARKTALENDCKSILYISGTKSSYVMEKRLAGLKRLTGEHEMKLLVKCGDFSERKARELAMKYARNKDMIVCASDLMAIGAMNALIEMDIFRPVCGFDGITLMGYVGRQMNTVRQNFSYIASEAVKELTILLSGGIGRERILDYELVRMKYEDIIC